MLCIGVDDNNVIVEDTLFDFVNKCRKELHNLNTLPVLKFKKKNKKETIDGITSWQCVSSDYCHVLFVLLL